jgi:UDPglucose--hexose-1-phosphate uridylyltransferase
MSVEPVRRLLADGREILYFDDRPGSLHDAVDTRRLEPGTAGGSQLRGDPMSGEWTIVAPHRQGRTFQPLPDACPLCPTRDGRLTEIPAARYDVVVFENRFPAFAGEGTATLGAPDADPATWAVAQGTGRCEVVVPTDQHETTLAMLPEERMRTLVDAWSQRSAELGARPGVAAVGVFENRGAPVGVTLHHTHQQIYAFPFVPPVTAHLQRCAVSYRERTGNCVVCDRLAAERAEGSRVVISTEDWTAYVPFAARWPFEVHVVPTRHVRGLPDLETTERRQLAGLWRELFHRYDSLFPAGRLPTIAAWHQTPTAAADGHLLGQAFSLQRDETKQKFLAGSESAYGAWLLDVPAERAAELLRAAG